MSMTKVSFEEQVKYYAVQLKMTEQQVKEEILQAKTNCEKTRMSISEENMASIWGQKHGIDLEGKVSIGGAKPKQPYIMFKDALGLGAKDSANARGYVLAVNTGGRGRILMSVADEGGIGEVYVYRQPERCNGIKEGDAVFFEGISAWKRSNDTQLTLGDYGRVYKVENDKVINLPKYSNIVKPTNIADMKAGETYILKSIVWKPIDRKYVGCSNCRRTSNVSKLAEGQFVVCDKCGQKATSKEYNMKGMMVSDASKEDMSCMLPTDTTIQPSKLVGEVIYCLGRYRVNTAYNNSKEFRVFKLLENFQEAGSASTQPQYTDKDLEVVGLEVVRLNTLLRVDLATSKDIEGIIALPSAKCKKDIPIDAVMADMMKKGTIVKTEGAGYYKFKE